MIEMSGLGTLNGKPRKTYLCQDHDMINKNTKEIVHVTGCGCKFTTCGNPQSCPKCHVPLPIADNKEK